MVSFSFSFKLNSFSRAFEIDSGLYGLNKIPRLPDRISGWSQTLDAHTKHL